MPKPLIAHTEVNLHLSNPITCRRSRMLSKHIHYHPRQIRNDTIVLLIRNKPSISNSQQLQGSLGRVLRKPVMLLSSVQLLISIRVTDLVISIPSSQRRMVLIRTIDTSSPLEGCRSSTSHYLVTEGDESHLHPLNLPESRQCLSCYELLAIVYRIERSSSTSISTPVKVYGNR